MKTLDELRRFTVARNFFPPTTLKTAIQKMGFVQADPIRAPARAQDLILRHRVKDYRAGDLESRYASLGIDEDVFVNYGFVTRKLKMLMHPRADLDTWTPPGVADADQEQLLAFVRERNEVHPREVDEHFAHGRLTNFWGGSSNATTKSLELMHYRGLLRVVRREKGIRIYCASEVELLPDSGASSSTSFDVRERDARIDALVDTVVDLYGPLSNASLWYYVRRLRYATPQWSGQLANALRRAKERLAQAKIDGLDWFWTKRRGENALGVATQDKVRLLAPFDPLVHDRGRFEMLWGWAYRFEAYTPISKRKLGYYALPLLWRDHVIGWANLSVQHDELDADLGFVKSAPRERVFKRELEAEVERFRAFLRLSVD